MYPLRAVRIWFFVLALAVSGAAAGQRVEMLVRGQIHHTGNSLGLSGQPNANGPGNVDSVHTLMALSPFAVDASPANPGNPWFQGTTADWSSAGSSGLLTLPPGATVLHAVLLWGGSYNYASENLSAVLDVPIQLTTPAGVVSVPSDAAYAQTLDLVDADAVSVRYYRRGAVVTAAVIAAGSGIYVAAGIPVTQHELINTMNGGGWALLVFAEDASSTCRRLGFDLPVGWVDSATDVTIHFAQSTPAVGPVLGRALFAVADGDANRSGDHAMIRDPVLAASWLPLSGPNNPETNFFAAQVNDHDGMLDESGTFGDRNHNATSGSNVVGGRQGWDLTAVPLSSAAGQLAPQQTITSLRLETTGDSYLPVFVALEVDAAGGCSACIFRSGFEDGETACE